MAIIDLDWDRYLDRVQGCWLGKCVAGTLGAPFEGWKGEMDMTFCPTAIKANTPNDDLDLQILWLEVLEERGLDITSDDLADAFDRRCHYNPGEYGYFRKNWRRGIPPPFSGAFNNRYYVEGMGCPIRSEIWACICPGQPELAASFAAKDGILDHAGASVWFEQYLAAVEADVLVSGDPDAALRRHRHHLPAGSRARALVDDVLAWCDSDRDWRSIRRLILRDYGHPDCTNSYQNIGITLLAVQRGGGDLIATAMLALNCGYDTDCTCATAGSIIGAAVGNAALQQRHCFPDQGFRLGVTSRRAPIGTIDELTQATCRIGAAVAQRFGGCRLAGVPALAPLPAPAPAPRLEVDHPGGVPVIAPGETRTVVVRVVNPTAAPVTGTLTVEAPAPWSCRVPAGAVTAAPGASIDIPVEVTVPADIPVLEERNLLRATLRTPQGAVERRIGLNGAQLWRVSGPVWQQYADIDGIRIEEKYYDYIKPDAGETMVDRVRQVHLNQRADIATGPAEDGTARVVAIREDRFTVGDLVGCQGPCVIEAERLVVSPERRELHLVIGHSDAYRVWLNGTLVDSQDRADWWTAENRHAGPLVLEAGVNRLRIRLARRSAEAEFSLIFMAKATMGEQTPDLASVNPR